MVMYYSFAQPRAVIWQMYLCTVAIVYACTGTAYFLSQVWQSWVFGARFSEATHAVLHAVLHADTLCVHVSSFEFIWSTWTSGHL